MRDYTWICKSCGKIEVLNCKSYSYRKTKGKGNCQSCSQKLRLIKSKHPAGWNKGLKGYMKGHPPYFVAHGKKNPAWKGGVTSENMKIRNSKKYQEWRNSVFKRDNYICQICGQIGGNLCADHIKPFSLFKEVRFCLDNGRTLCFECHKKTDTYLSKINSYVV